MECFVTHKPVLYLMIPSICSAFSLDTGAYTATVHQHTSRPSMEFCHIRVERQIALSPMTVLSAPNEIDKLDS